MKLTALYSGLLVKKWQNKESFLYLHSTFKHSFNLTDGKNLIHVGILDNNIVPFGLFFTKEDFYILRKIIYEKAIVIIVEQSVLNIGNIEVDLCDTIFYEPLPLFLKNLPFVFVESLTYSARVLNENTGLDFINEIMGKSPYLKYCYSTNQIEIMRYLMHYIGQGPGLTPSGDDFTVGILAVNHVYPYLSAVFTDSLREYIKSDVTTDVSRAYLNAALSGHFSMRVNQVMESLCHYDIIRFEESVMLLKKIGNTSGYDTLMGIFIGIQQIMKII